LINCCSFPVILLNIISFRDICTKHPGCLVACVMLSSEWAPSAVQPKDKNKLTAHPVSDIWCIFQFLLVTHELDRKGL
jgi:hypothetical protein